MPGEERNIQPEFHLETFISEHDFSKPPPRPHLPHQQNLLQLPHDPGRSNYRSWRHRRSRHRSNGPYFRYQNYPNRPFTYCNSRFQQFRMQETAQTPMQKHSYLQPPLPLYLQPPLPPYMLPLQTPPKPPDILYKLSAQPETRECVGKTSTESLAPHQQTFMMPPYTNSSYIKPFIHRDRMFSCTSARNNNLNTVGEHSRSERQNYNEPYRSSSFRPKQKKDKKKKIDGQIKNKVKTLIWNEDDEERAFKEEQKVMKQKIRIEFPDCEYYDCVKAFHENIENVFFKVPYGQRYCYVTTKSGTDIDEVIEDLRKIQLKNKNFLRVTKMNEDFIPGIINPCAFYITNIPDNNLNVYAKLKEIFTKSENIKIKPNRPRKFCAIVSFGNTDDAINAFRENLNCMLGLAKLRIRFLRRKKLIITTYEDENQFENNEKKMQIEDSRNNKVNSDNEGRATSHCNAREQITVKKEKLSSLNTEEIIKEDTNCDFKNTFIKEIIVVNNSRESITAPEVKNEFVDSDLPVCLKTSVENHSSVKLANVQKRDKYSEISNVNSTQKNDTEKLICWSKMEDQIYSCFSEKPEFRIMEEKENSYPTIIAVSDKEIESHLAKVDNDLVEKKVFIAESCDIHDKNCTKENKVITEDSNEQNLSSKITKEKIMDENCNVKNVNNDEENKELKAEDDLQNTKKLAIEDCCIQDRNNEKKSKETITRDLSAENLYKLAQISTQDLVNPKKGNKKEANLETKEYKTSDNTKCITDDIKFEPGMPITYHLLKNMSNHENGDTEKLKNDEYYEKLDAVQLVTADIVEEENTEISINVDTLKNEDRVEKKDIDRKYSLNQLSEGDCYNILTDDVRKNKKPHEANKLWDGDQHLLHQERLNVDLSEFIDIKQNKNLKTEKQAPKQSVQATKAVYEMISCIAEKTNTDENDIREIVELQNMNEEKELVLEFNKDSYEKQLTTQKDTNENNQPFSQESVEVILERNSKNDSVEELNVNADTQVRAQKNSGTGVQNDSVLDNSSNCLGESMRNKNKESDQLTRDIVDGVSAKDKLISLHHKKKQRDNYIEIPETQYIVMYVQNASTTLTDDDELEKDNLNMKHKFHAHNFVEHNNQNTISSEEENVQHFQHKELNIEIYVNSDVFIIDNVTNYQGELFVTDYNIKQGKEEVSARNTLTGVNHLKQKEHSQIEITNMNHETLPVCKQIKSSQAQQCMISAQDAITTLTDDSELQKQTLNVEQKFLAHNFAEQNNQDDISNEEENAQPFHHKEVNNEIYVNSDVVINNDVTNYQGELSVTECNNKQLKEEVGARNKHKFHAHNFVEHKNIQDDISKEEENKKSSQKKEINIDESVKRDVAINDDVKNFQEEISVNESSSKQQNEIGAKIIPIATQHVREKKGSQNEKKNMNHDTKFVCKAMKSSKAQQYVISAQNVFTTLTDDGELQKQELNMNCEFHSLNNCFGEQKNYQEKILKEEENGKYSLNKEVNTENSERRSVIILSDKELEEMADVGSKLSASQCRRENKFNQNITEKMNPVQMAKSSPTSDIVTTTTTNKKIRKRKSVIIYNNKLLKEIIDLTGEQTSSSDLIENKHNEIVNYNISHELKPVQIAESSPTGDIVTNDNSKHFEKKVSDIKCYNKQPEEIVDLRIEQTVLENHKEEKFNEISKNLSQEMKSVHIVELLSAGDVVINDKLRNFQEEISVSKGSSNRKQLKQNIDLTSKLTSTQHLEETKFNMDIHSDQNQVMKHCPVALSKMEDYQSDMKTENKLCPFQSEISDENKPRDEFHKQNKNKEDKVNDLNTAVNNSEFYQLRKDNYNEQLKPEVNSKSVNQSSGVKEIIQTHAVSSKNLAEEITDPEENTERKSYSGCGSTRHNKLKRKKSSFKSNKFANTRANSDRRKEKLILSVSESESGSEEEEKYVDNEQYELEQIGNLKFKLKKKIQSVKECSGDIRVKATEIEEMKMYKEKRNLWRPFNLPVISNGESVPKRKNFL